MQNAGTGYAAAMDRVNNAMPNSAISGQEMVKFLEGKVKKLEYELSNAF
jgi:hypothetical protein